MYLTYEEYYDLGGAELPHEVFTRLEYAASKLVQAHTFARVDKMNTVPEAVKRLVSELILIEINAQTVRRGETGAISSFSNDGYSESYGETMNAEYFDALESDMIYKYLIDESDDNGVPLLYRGV